MGVPSLSTGQLENAHHNEITHVHRAVGALIPLALMPQTDYASTNDAKRICLQLLMLCDSISHGLII